MTVIRRCALITRFADTRVAESASLVARHLASRGLEALASEDERDRLQGVETRFLSESALIRAAELIIAIGGDGTLLYAAGLVAERGTPLLGVNRGRLGFLTDVMPEDMLSSVDAALAGQCLRDERPLLRAEIKSTAGSTVSGLALNDVVLQKRQSGHLIDFETWIDGHFVNIHGGDGLVVASATGSTAYALSCGGPIVDPSLEVVVVTPICPHTLSDRPIVVSARSAIEIRIIDRPDSSAEVACDGRSLAPLNTGESLVIRTAGARITLLHPEGYDYYRLLRSKLNWGRRSFDA
ncbi:MAG: NAD(+) kinase [Gammaproteobacteria bacterium]|nr:NAD(+) kinase [Gammaproteobacteria bacterium]